MASSHFNNWSPRVPIDLHHHRTASPVSPAATATGATGAITAASTNTTPAASHLNATMSQSQPQPHPQVPAQLGHHNPSGTAAVPMLPPPAAKGKAPSRPTRPFSSGSFTSPPFTIRDSVSGGLLSSTSFLSNSSSDVASGAKQASTNAKPVDSASVPRSNSGGGNASSSSSSSSKILQQPPEKIRPIYHPFSNMGGFVQPSRSLSYAGTPNTRLSNLTGAATFNDPNSHSANIRKSLSLGKPAKKGIKSRLRKLRQKQGSSSREAGANAFMTSGESDSEAAFDHEPETFFNSGGIAHKFISSSSNSNSKSSKLGRPKLTHQGASLPPHPPHRHNTSNSISFAYGGKSGGTSGGEHGPETQKETSAVRFKDLFKNVGQYSAGATLSPSNTISENHGGCAAGGASKPLQSRSTFPLFGDFLSGDDQPTATTKFRLTGPGRRKRRFTKKSHSAGGGMLATPRSAAATDDEDSGTSRSGTHRTPHHHPSHHNFLHHLHRRHRSRSIGEDARPQASNLWKQEQVETQERPMSSTLRDARQANTDPNVLLTELEPLPAQFLCDFAALSNRGPHVQHPPPPLPQAPLVTHITPTSTAGSGLVALFSPPSTTTSVTAGTTLSNQQSIGAQPRLLTGHPEAIVAKTFLFQSYQNSQFQGHYLFRVIGDHVEYKRLPLTLKQPCSQYFHKAYVTYRSFEKKYKALKEDRERRQVTGPFWSKTLGSESPQLRHGSSDHHTATLSTTVATKNQYAEGMQRTNSEGDITKSSIAWDQVRQGQESAAALASLQAQDNNVQPSRKTGYQDQRYNPESSSNDLVRSIIGARDRSKSVDIRQWSSGLSGSGQPLAPSQRPQSYHIRKRSWASIREQHRLELEQQQAAEEYHWKEMERRYREEFRQATYGLQLYLTEIIQGSAEFERFDTVFNVTIDENRRGDTAVFSIENGDKTNKMWLESPSAKLKYEFLNWIALSSMDHGEPVVTPVVAVSETPRRESHLDAFMGPVSAKSRAEEDVEYVA